MILSILLYTLFSTNTITYTTQSLEEVHCSNHMRWFQPINNLEVYQGPDYSFPKVNYKESSNSFASDYIVENNGDRWIHHANGIGFIPINNAVDITYYQNDEYCNIITANLRRNYTGNSFWINECLANKLVIVENIKKRGTSYSYDQIYEIVNTYEYYGKLTEVDWVLALGQNMHETDWLKSWWSQPPRRNFAGIGVYGISAYNQEGSNWSCLENGLCYHGFSYKNFDDSIRSHIGLILNYVVKLENATENQKELMNLYELNYGTFDTPNSMNGTWAVPGLNYGNNIAIRANQLLEE